MTIAESLLKESSALYLKTEKGKGMLSPDLHGPCKKRVSAEAKGILRPTKVTPTNRGGQGHRPLGKPKANMAAPEGQRALGETKHCLKKMVHTTYVGTSSG